MKNGDYVMVLAPDNFEGKNIEGNIVMNII